VVGVKASYKLEVVSCDDQPEFEVKGRWRKGHRPESRMQPFLMLLPATGPMKTIPGFQKQRAAPLLFASGKQPPRQ
jgi:hypothetical protein